MFGPNNTSIIKVGKLFLNAMCNMWRFEFVPHFDKETIISCMITLDDPLNGRV